MLAAQVDDKEIGEAPGFEEGLKLIDFSNPNFSMLFVILLENSFKTAKVQHQIWVLERKKKNKKVIILWIK